MNYDQRHGNYVAHPWTHQQTLELVQSRTHLHFNRNRPMRQCGHIHAGVCRLNREDAVAHVTPLPQVKPTEACTCGNHPSLPHKIPTWPRTRPKHPLGHHMGPTCMSAPHGSHIGYSHCMCPDASHGHVWIGYKHALGGVGVPVHRSLLGTGTQIPRRKLIYNAGAPRVESLIMYFVPSQNTC